MAISLRQSTAATIKLGPFVDAVDGTTPENGLSIQQTDVLLDKNGGGFDSKHQTDSAPLDEEGWYDVLLDTDDTATLGRLVVACAMTGARPVHREIMVMPANVWDSLFGSDRLKVTAAENTSGIAGAVADQVWDQSMFSGAANSPKLRTYNSRIFAVNTNSRLQKYDDTIEYDAGVDAYRFTETALANIPGGGTPLTAQETRDAMKLAPSAGDPAAGSIDAHLDTIEADTDEMQGDLADGGRIDLILDAILADTGTDGVAISVAMRQAIADEILRRGVANVESEADATSLAALVLACLSSTISGSTWTIYRTDGVTPFATRMVTSDPNADLIVEVT